MIAIGLLILVKSAETALASFSLTKRHYNATTRNGLVTAGGLKLINCDEITESPPSCLYTRHRH